MIDQSDVKRLKQRAQALLDEGWTGDFTVPANGLYPHQWGWDTGWIAMGLSTYRPDRARKEFRGLMRAQWDNGMVPQIVFNPDARGEYFPGPGRWGTRVSLNAPDHVRTSGIVQPPVQAMAARKIYRRSEEPEATQFLRAMYPKLLDWHTYLHRERDPREESLVYIRHPWESLDNCPDWDPALENIDLDEVEVEPYERVDLQKDVPEEHRPSDEKYDRYIHLVDLFRSLKYDEAAIFDHTDFLVQDPLFNAILVKSNQALAEIARILGEDPRPSEVRAEKTALALRLKLWSKEKERFVCRDMVQKRDIDKPTASSFVPFLGEIPNRRQATRMFRSIDSVGFCPSEQRSSQCWSVPTYNMYSGDFDRDNYWRGPVWGYTNKLIGRGLRDNGYVAKASAIEKDFIALVHRHGFAEYYDPIEGGPLGTRPFLTTAAHLLDLLASYEYEM